MSRARRLQPQLQEVEMEQQGCCEHSRFRFTSAWEWVQSKQFDRDFYGPEEEGVVRLVCCTTRHGYHHVPVGEGEPHWTTRTVQ